MMGAARLAGPVLAMAAAAAVAAQAPGPAFVLRCGRTHVGDGSVLDAAWLVIRDGRIAELSRVEPAAAASLPVVDVRDKVVMPGIVAADSDLSGQGDADYQVTPDLVAAEGFDWASDRQRQLAGGVTTAYLSPGRNRLVPGQGSVVKLAGSTDGRLLLASSCLRVTLGEASTKAPALFEPTAAPTADDPLVGARRQLPSARISQLAELREVFRRAQLEPADLPADAGSPAVENRYDPEPLLRVLRGELRLRIAALRADDIRRAVQLAGAMGADLVLEDPAEIDKVGAVVARAGAMASFRVPVRLGAPNPGGENRDDRQPRLEPGAPAAAARLGVPVALAAATDDDLADMLMVAAVAIRHGLAEPAAMAGITGVAARLLGVDGRVGTLVADRDADFLVLSGEPFATGTAVEQTWVEGELVYERPSSSALLAVKAPRILVGNGTVIRDGVVLVAGGKIKAIGENLAVPYGARVIETEGVVVPGFVDGYCHVGLSSRGGDGAIPRGSPDQLVADAVDRADPLLREVLAAGVTTVLVAGRDDGAVSGRAAALKTGARDREAMILRETAAVRLVHDTVGPDALETLDSTITRTKRYIEAWQKYEKAIAEGREDEVVLEDRSAGEDPITGVWEGDLESDRIPFPVGYNFSLKLDGEQVSGQVTVLFRGRERPPVDIDSGTFKDGKLELTYNQGFGGTVRLTATVQDDEMEGELDGGFLRGRFTARRVSKDANAEIGSNGGGLRKPRVDEKLEPIRALLEGRATAVIRSTKGPAIAAAAAWAQGEKLRFVFHAANDAARTAGILGEHAAGVMLEPDFVERDDGEVFDRLRALLDAGVEVALTSAATAGARYLPVHAAYAVRYGVDPGAALRAITLAPAKMLGLDDRIGSLEPGKDADLVVFSGEPFELTSRIEAVVCDGEVVVDRRPAGRQRR